MLREVTRPSTGYGLFCAVHELVKPKEGDHSGRDTNAEHAFSPNFLSNLIVEEHSTVAVTRSTARLSIMSSLCTCTPNVRNFFQISRTSSLDTLSFRAQANGEYVGQKVNKR